jgi:hypothetical protein
MLGLAFRNVHPVLGIQWMIWIGEAKSRYGQRALANTTTTGDLFEEVLHLRFRVTKVRFLVNLDSGA